jgi:hypothetical protein
VYKKWAMLSITILQHSKKWDGKSIFDTLATKSKIYDFTAPFFPTVQAADIVPISVIRQNFRDKKYIQTINDYD